MTVEIFITFKCVLSICRCNFFAANRMIFLVIRCESSPEVDRKLVLNKKLWQIENSTKSTFFKITRQKPTSASDPETPVPNSLVNHPPDFDTWTTAENRPGITAQTIQSAIAPSMQNTSYS